LLAAPGVSVAEGAAELDDEESLEEESSSESLSSLPVPVPVGFSVPAAVELPLEVLEAPAEEVPDAPPAPAAMASQIWALISVASVFGRPFG